MRWKIIIHFTSETTSNLQNLKIYDSSCFLKYFLYRNILK
jgi:hypothetical protein